MNLCLKTEILQMGAVLISLTKTKTKMIVNENTFESLTKTKIETKILAKTNIKQ